MLFEGESLSTGLSNNFSYIILLVLLNKKKIRSHVSASLHGNIYLYIACHPLILYLSFRINGRNGKEGIVLKCWCNQCNNMYEWSSDLYLLEKQRSRFYVNFGVVRLGCVRPTKGFPSSRTLISFFFFVATVKISFSSKIDLWCWLLIYNAGDNKNVIPHAMSYIYIFFLFISWIFLLIFVLEVFWVKI